MVRGLSNTRCLADRRWFKALLATGIAGLITLPLFGVGALIAGGGMLVYLVGAPESTHEAPGTSAPPRVWPKAAIVHWSTWVLVPLLGSALFALVVANLGNPGGVLHGHVWMSLVLVTLCAVTVVCSAFAEAAGWVAALFNVHLLADKTWFNVLLWTGIVAILTMPLLGLGALIAAAVGIAYLAAAPDGLVAGGTSPDGRRRRRALHRRASERRSRTGGTADAHPSDRLRHRRRSVLLDPRRSWRCSPAVPTRSSSAPGLRSRQRSSESPAELSRAPGPVWLRC